MVNNPAPEITPSIESVTGHPVSEVLDEYPLTALQEGMLYHALTAPERGADLDQMVCSFPDAVEPEHLRSAWDQVAARHAVLRTRFRWDEGTRQQVLKHATLPFQTISSSDAEFEEFLRQDRELGFDLGVAPLARLTLVNVPSGARLVWTFHHAILDGRSQLLVLEDALTRYRMLRSGSMQSEESPAPPAFRDFVLWQRDLLDHTRGATENFWRETLRGFSAPTALAIDRVPVAIGPSGQGERCEVIGAALTTQLRELARTHRCGLDTLIHAAWAALLSRYSGSEDVVFGVARACRWATAPGADEMVGLLINTLPLRVDVPGDLPVSTWWSEIRKRWLALRPHEHSPLSLIQSWSHVPTGQRLFDSLVVFEEYDLNEALKPAGVKVELHEQNSFALTLAVAAGTELSLKLQYDVSRVHPELVDRALGHLKMILEAFVADAQTLVGRLPLLTGSELAELTAGIGTQDYPSNIRLEERFSKVAKTRTESIAVVSEGRELTYETLDTRSSELAAVLRRQGIQPGAIVGLYSQRTENVVIGLLAILKAGAAYLPIDLAYPNDRIAFMLDDAGAKLLLTETELLDRAAGIAAQKVCIDATPVITSAEPDTPDSSLSPDSTAYVIYTSGSTGRPKGVPITHRNVARLFTATDEWFKFSDRDVWTLFHSPAFDFSVWEIWGALLYGGKLVVVPHEVSRSPEAFHELLVDQQVTVLNQTPSAFRSLIAADTASARSSALALRTVIFGGEALNPRDLAPWFARHGDTQPQLVNMYGITETTVHVTYRPLRTEDSLTTSSIIGIPIPDLGLYVLDAQFRPVPVGVPGELFVAGAGLAHGYLNRPELTESRFVANPFDEAQNSRLYRTGDLVRWLPGRELDYLGRIDQQVKIRGFRIELGEIESVLLDQPRVREAAVVARPNHSGDVRLIAYVVPADDTPIAVEDLRNAVKERLPDYMIPAAFISLANFPLTTNGKLDRAALPEPATHAGETNVSATMPHSAMERSIAEVWQELLGVGRVGLDSNFFDLGGHSLLLIQLHSRLHALRKTDLKLTELFRFSTIRLQAERLTQGDTAPANASNAAADRAQKQRNAIQARAAVRRPISR